MRSCSRSGRPCQNSTESNASRYPPQNGGRAMSPAALACSTSAYCRSKSSRIESREDLERQYAEVEQANAAGDMARPPFWGGYRLAFDSVEFWQGRPDRLHDRIRFVRGAGGWTRERLQP